MPDLSTTTAPVDPRRAVAEELLTRLGPAASQYSPAQLAQAANTILARRQPPSTDPQGMADTSQQVAQRPDVSSVSAAAANAPPSAMAQHVKDIGLGIAQTIGDAANAIRYQASTGGWQTAARLDAMTPEQAVAQAHQQDAAFKALTPEQQQSVGRGVAFITSAAAAPAVASALPVIPGVINKATNYLIANALGGAVYGATAPVPEGQTRTQATLQATGQFGLAGGAADFLGAAAFGKIPWKEPITGFLPTTKQAVVAEGGQLAQDLAHATVTGKAPSTAFQKAPDALRSLTDEQLAAHPLGQTPPLAQSAAAPGVLDAQVHAVSQGVLAKDAMSPQVVQRALKQQAIDVAVAHTPTVQLATPEMQSAVADVMANPPTANVGELAGQAFAAADPDAHFAAHIGDHIDIPPATQLPPLTGDIAPGSLPSLNIAQSLQFIAKSQEQLDAIAASAKAYRDQATQATLGRMGTAGFAARPVVTGLAGLGTSALGDRVEDEHPGMGSLLHTVGRLLETSAVLSIPGEFWASHRFAKTVISSLDATTLLSQPGMRESADVMGNLLTQHATQKEMLRRDLLKAFPDEASQRALAYIGGPNWNQSAHWESLNPAQQQAATAIVQGLHRDLAGVAQAAGVMGAARENYMPLGFQRRFYEEQFSGNATQATAALSQTGSWAKNRVFPDLATAEDWVRGKGLDPEQVLNHNGIDLTVNHFGSVMRAIDNKTLTDAVVHLGYLKPKEELIGGTTSFTPNAPGWRDVNVPELANRTAPDAVATLLENMARRPLNTTQAGRAYDLLSGLATRAVIYNRFIHGVNLFRENAFAGTGVDGYARAGDALQRNDPSILEWAGHGLDVLRPPYASRAVEALDATLAKGGHWDITTKALQAARGFLAGGEKVQEMIGTTGLVVANKEQAAFAMRHPDILPGSPAWNSNMDRIARYANDVAGRVPNWFRSPAASKFMSRVFLAPQWLETRWNLMRKGLIDEPQTVLNGGLPPSDALYSKFKMRQLAIVAAGTAALSYALSGSAPVFNPQTGKFYAKTGLKDSQGNDIGFDPWGFGQDELTLFGSQSPLWPATYLNRKTSPAINIATQVKFGRDFRGRELAGPEAAENAFSNLGGIAQGAEFLGRTAINAAQGQTPTAGEAIRGVATTGGLGGFSQLQDDQQVYLAAQAAKILGQYGIPANGERVWNLTRLMQSDARRSGGKNAFGYLSGSYVANEQRQLGKQHPYSWLWYHVKSAFAQMVQ